MTATACATFNSLFEMPREIPPGPPAKDMFQLSILYLRCDMASLCCMASLPTQSFNSLFEMLIFAAYSVGLFIYGGYSFNSLFEILEQAPALLLRARYTFQFSI